MQIKADENFLYWLFYIVAMALWVIFCNFAIASQTRSNR